MDFIINSQRTAASKRFSAGPEKINPLLPFRWQSLVQPMAAQWLYMLPQGTPTLGLANTFILPNGNLIGDLISEVTLGTPTGGNYSPFVGMGILDRIVLTSNTETIQDFYIDSVHTTLMSTITASVRSTILAAAGSATNAAGTYSYPIPTFWSRFANGQVEYGGVLAPLPMNLIGRLQMDIWLRSLALIEGSGTTNGSITGMKLWFQSISTTGEARSQMQSSVSNWIYKSIDWQTLRNVYTYGSANTDVSVDLTALNGSVTKINLQNKTTLATNDYQACGSIVHARIVADGQEISNQFGVNSMLLMQMLSSSVYTDATYGDSFTVRFSISYPAGVSSAYTGSLDTNLVTKLTCENFNSTATGSVQVCAALDVIFVIRNGSLTRLR